MSNEHDPVVLMKVGDTFKCGPNGSITGTIVAAGEPSKNDLYEDTSPEYMMGYIYKLDAPVVVFKNVRYGHYGIRRVIRLRIPANTLIRAGFKNPADNFKDDDCSYKCRAERAIVLPYRKHDGQLDWCYSGHDNTFKYVPNTMIEPKNGKFDMDPNDQCSIGIHFFFEKDRAERYR